jgi:hypothetical protein
MDDDFRRFAMSIEDLPSFDKWFSSYRVRAVRTRLYPNGRQQADIEVTLTMSPGVTLKPEELQSLRLVVRNDDGQLVQVPDTGSVAGGWFYSGTPNEYSPYPESSADIEQEATTAADATAVVVRHFYVMNDSTRSLLEREFFLRIRLQWLDNWYELFSDGSNNDSVESATLVTAAIPVFAIADYSFDSQLQEGSEGTGVAKREYHLAPRPEGRPVLNVLSAHVEPPGMIRWAAQASTSRHASFVGHAQPELNAAYVYDENIPVGVPKQVSPIVPRQGFVAFIVQSNLGIEFHQESAERRGGPCVCTMVDEYGNSHRLVIGFDPTPATGRFTLVLS